MPIKNRTKSTTLQVEYVPKNSAGADPSKVARKEIPFPSNPPHTPTCQEKPGDNVEKFFLNEVKPHTEVTITQKAKTSEGNYLVIRIDKLLQPVRLTFTYPGDIGDGGNVTVGEDQ